MCSNEQHGPLLYTCGSFKLVWSYHTFRFDSSNILFLQGIFTHLGCYSDNVVNRALPNIEGTHQLLTGNFLTRENAISKCATVAKEKGYKVFGIQDGGWCATSTNGHLTFNRYGKADNCVNGKGGMLAFDVYAINCKYT